MGIIHPLGEYVLCGLPLAVEFVFVFASPPFIFFEHEFEARYV